MTSCLERRLERLWCGRLYWPDPGSLRGWFSVRERRRDAGKCDNLSFLGVFLERKDKVRGGISGYVLGERGRAARSLTGVGL